MSRYRAYELLQRRALNHLPPRKGQHTKQSALAAEHSVSDREKISESERKFAILMIAQTPFDAQLLQKNSETPQSPGAGEGAAGKMPDAGSLPVSVHFSTM